ncbi:hypothetical protein E1B28_003943 [Marasmius oreades]|uniref:Tetratricopeptide repeat protein 39B n=1 Tax=Marasmius oreades TaxID=181124 RepID=A0A9P7UXJ6_9AGAR|nr:uncharacterized protein E1B28_003943 [Marasmius oreades]KAG7096514.1 hypothetical protein E1B28_003943 [Marasmius oreades]
MASTATSAIEASKSLDSTSSAVTSNTASSPPSSDGFATPATSAYGKEEEDNTTLGEGGKVVERPSYRSIYTSPPPIKQSYKPSESLDDIPGLAYALDLFLASHMVEAEQYCVEKDEKMERMYFATGFGLIQCVKGLMSYADEDLLSGIGHTKHGNHIASQHRKKAASFTSRLAGYVVSSLNTHGVGFIKSMTDLERHAELTYAESLFEKALLGIVYSGDWLAFIKEALNMRAIIGIYRNLYKYITTMDAEYVATLPDSSIKEDPLIDVHFRSGVYLGAGLSTLILSLLPAKLLTIVEMFGYHGERKEALEILCKAGGWTKDSSEPSVNTEEEGLRRSICDMALLVFHLVLSSFTFDGVDISMAQKIVDWNLKRYPDGVFFLFGAGRLSLIRSQPQRAIQHYTHAMEVQTQYRNLHHISFWEIAICSLALWDISGSEKAWRTLEREATWSKAIYTYGLAVCLLELSDKESDKREERRKELVAFMEKVPNLKQRIAGKSIPLEKFVARKARKFQSQEGRLALPALEIAYIFLGIAHAPPRVVSEKMLPEVRQLLKKLEACGGDPKKYEGGVGYWDDYCLAKFLEGVCLRYIAYPDPDAELEPDDVAKIAKEEAEKNAADAFKFVFEHGPSIELDHHLVYHAHYELGRLLVCQGDIEGGKKHFDMIISGKYLEVGPSGRKGKYSMENALHMRTHAAIDDLP